MAEDTDRASSEGARDAARATPLRGHSAGGFAQALEGLEATGASDAIRELVALLAEHGVEEEALLDGYERLAASVTDPAARYLLDMILVDERRHHQVLVDIATAMAWGTLGSLETSVPGVGWHLDEELLEATRRLREHEEEDRTELRALRARLRPFEESTLWALLVDSMLFDTDKHATMLRFLEQRAR